MNMEMIDIDGLKALSCKNPAKFEVYNKTSGRRDDATEMCAEHVGQWLHDDAWTEMVPYPNDPNDGGKDKCCHLEPPLVAATGKMPEVGMYVTFFSEEGETGLNHTGHLLLGQVVAIKNQRSEPCVAIVDEFGKAWFRKPGDLYSMQVTKEWPSKPYARQR